MLRKQLEINKLQYFTDQLKEQNHMLQSRVVLCENRLQQSSQKNVMMLYQQIQQLQDRNYLLSHDLGQLQKIMKATVISEVVTENKILQDELVRMRLLLESKVKGESRKSRLVR